ncbi:MAG TPA: hypothetical protein VKC82_05560 [Burkholderiales bacterium]|nr:hypothetical protein [Burkholderiales bacterium]
MKTTSFVSSRALVLAWVALLGGCATGYKPIQLEASFWQDRQSVVGVVTETIPEPAAQMTGGQGLLDVAINRGNAGPMVDQLKRLDIKRAAAISENLANGLSGRGIKVNKLETIDVKKFPDFKHEVSPALYASRNFQELKAQGIDRLLLVSVVNIGTVRPYYGFIPMGPPRATFAVKGQLVDLKDNKLLWYNSQSATAVIAEPWDQEPDFPNLSAAVLKNLSDGAALFERSFFTTPTK